MRHMVAGRKFGKSPAHRRAMFRNMAINLFKFERIKTTDTKAKELKKFAEKLITWGKKGDLHSRRLARSYIEDRMVLDKLFKEIAQRFAKRKGGYTRIIKLGYRKGDAAPVSFIELIPDTKPKSRKEAKDKGKKKTKDKAEKTEIKKKEAETKETKSEKEQTEKEAKSKEENSSKKKDK